MADTKISQMTDGGAVQDTDIIPAVRAGANVKVVVGTAAALDAGTANGDLVQLQNVGGSPGLPAVKGSLLTNVAVSFTDGLFFSILGALSDGDYLLAGNLPYAGTITEITTQSTSGTATGTFKINSTPLGGTANAISSAQDVKAHSSSNTFAAGAELFLTISANAACVDLSVTIKVTRQIGG